ncbi:MAG: phosphatidylserine synthase [Flavobacteriaceae bacterium]|nr:CDP-alcohol phosphatidyltransferase family protein [Eudoraea sp.]MBT8311531.1 CDP-alcohol phosphatidyltransferase family protein [Eudoraea sp.]NNJ37932.1 phosphatidylserine synthase [Flavobacteriaceae bacterium]NNJ41520.1 phosphatidylserine synthase [Eudoraea sp.]
MIRHLPQLLTLLNVFSGCVAVVFAVLNELHLAAVFVIIGIFFDFFDGLAARMLNAQSELGIQLDSLADMITCGLVPGIIMFQLLGMSQTGGWNIADFNPALREGPLEFDSLIPFAGFLITLASAYRLARFNIDEDQLTSFIGLPTPANALLIISFPLILLYQGNDSLNALILNPWFLLVVTVLSSFLLNANIPLFALKFKNWSFKENGLRYVFIVVSIVLLMTMKYLAISAIVVFYVLSSLVYKAGAKVDQGATN